MNIPPEILCALSVVFLSVALFTLFVSGGVPPRPSIIPPRWMWPKSKKSAWVDVENRMPTREEGSAFLVGDGYGIEKAYLSSDGTDFSYDNERLLGHQGDITHWRSLPTEPKERKR